MIQWWELPSDQYFGWGLEEKKDRLEQEIREKTYERIYQDTCSDAIDDVHSLAVRIEEEKDRIHYTTDLLESASKQSRYANIAQDLLTTEEGLNLDGFHYVHAQTWYLILTEAAAVEDTLETVAERSVDINHASDAYPVDREFYTDITEQLKRPLQSYILFGEQETQLVEDLTGYMDRDTARELVGHVEKRLYRSPYIEARDEAVDTVYSHLDLDPDLPLGELPLDLEESLTAVVVGHTTVDDLVDYLDPFTDTPDVIIDSLRDMQKHLENRSRTRLAKAVDNPEETDLRWTLSPSYLVEWPYPLAIYWQEHGEPPRYGSDHVHSNIGNTANKIRRYAQGRSLLSKDLLDQMRHLDIPIEPPAYWAGTKGKGKLWKPRFPITAYMEGMFYSGLLEGRIQKYGGNRLRYVFSDRHRNAPIRRLAYKRYNTFGEHVPLPVSTKERVQARQDNEVGKQNVHVTIPSCLTGIYRIHGFKNKTDIPPAYISTRFEQTDFVEGYVTQALWDWGHTDRRGTISYRARDGKRFADAIDRLGISYKQVSEPDPDTESFAHTSYDRIRIFASEADRQSFLREFQDTYQELVLTDDE